MMADQTTQEPQDNPDEAPKAAVPDISAPSGRAKEYMWWGIGIAGAGAVIAGMFYMKAHQPKDPAHQQQKIVTTSNIPDDYFMSPQGTPIKKQELPKEEPPKQEPPKDDGQQQKPVQKPKPRRSSGGGGATTKKLVEVPPTRIASQQLFSNPVPVVPVDPVAAFNDQRRTSGTAKVARAGRIRDAAEWVAKQEQWDDEDKTDATFPTDMSRVIPVTKYIPAILKNAINSELDGKVVAVIEENIYCAHGRKVCIPGGSEAVGRYHALKKPGDERIPVLWSRIITPQGINIHLGDAEMADAMGRSGITGEVDNRFMDRYGMALLVSTLSAATAYAVPVTTTGQQIVVQNYGSNLANLSSQILDKNINLKPKVSIPAGQRILISPTKDIWFPKPERRDITAMALDSLLAPQKGVRK